MVRKYEFSIVDLRGVIRDALKEIMTDSIAEIVFMKVDDEVENFLYDNLEKEEQLNLELSEDDSYDFCPKEGW